MHQHAKLLPPLATQLSVDQAPKPSRMKQYCLQLKMLARSYCLPLESRRQPFRTRKARTGSASWWFFLTSTQSKNKNPKKIPDFFAGIKIRVNPVPKNPGIWQNPGIENLDPAGAWAGLASQGKYMIFGNINFSCLDLSRFR